MKGEKKKDEPNVQADDNSIAIGGINIGGDLSGSITIGHGYTAEQVSVLLKQITSTFQPKPFDGRCPYKGLEVFEEEDAELFFGRERLVEDLIGRVQESRTVFITGPSGSGKSSLVRAGLIHALKQGAIKNLHSERWLYETLKPGRDPNTELARVVSSFVGTLSAGEDILTKGLSDATILARWCEVALKDSREKRAVIFIDQFEEVFTQISKEEERLAFLILLTHATAVENGRVILLFALRSDFISNCATYPELNRLLNQQFLQIGAMQPDELVSAIAQPALRVGLRIDPDLVAQIINDMQGEPGALPLMEFALKDLFDSQQGNGGIIALTLADYLRHGGIHKSLERHADTSFAKLSESEQQLARSIFSGLIEIGHGTQDTRRTALFDELIPANVKVEDVLAIVQKLADARLIITDEQAGKDTVTISHEKLIDAWPWLKKLVNENRDVIALQNQIIDDAQEWEQHNRDISYLYVGARLAVIREKASDLVLNEKAQVFVQASIDAEEQNRRRATRTRRWVLIGLSLTALVMAGLSLWGNSQATLANTNAANAQQQLARSESLRLAAEARSILNDPAGNAEEATILSLRALKSEYTAEADVALVESITRLDNKRPLLLNQSVDSYSAIFSPDGKTILARDFPSGEPSTIRLWDAQTGNELQNFKQSVSLIAFSPDGKTVLAGADNRYDVSVYQWDAATGKLLHEFQSPIDTTGGLTSIAASPDGKIVVAGRNDSSLLLWDVNTELELHYFGNTGPVSSVVFAPDGRTILTANAGSWLTDSVDKSARLWDVATGHELHAFKGHNKPVTSIAFSPDGKTILTGSVDKSARLWDVATGQELRVFSGHTKAVLSVAFSPNGKLILTGSSDQTARLWNASTGEELRIIANNPWQADRVAFLPDGNTIMIGDVENPYLLDVRAKAKASTFNTPGNSITSVAFSPDGRTVLMGSQDDNNARLWDVASRQELRVFSGHTDSVTSVAFSPDGRKILTGSEDNTARLWDLATGETLQTFSGHTDLLTSVAFSPDGKTILTGSLDITAKLWNISSGTELITFGGPSKGVESLSLGERRGYGISSAAFAHDGKTVVRAGAGTAIWDVATGAELLYFANTCEASSVAFSPDDKTILVGCKFAGEGASLLDATVSARNGTAWEAELKNFANPSGGVTSVAFSPDGNLILISGSDGIARLFDPVTGTEMRTFSGHSDSVTSVAFSPDGKTVLTGSADGIARLWDTDYHDTIKKACNMLLHIYPGSGTTPYDIQFQTPICKQWLQQLGATSPP